VVTGLKFWAPVTAWALPIGEYRVRQIRLLGHRRKAYLQHCLKTTHGPTQTLRKKVQHSVQCYAEKTREARKRDGNYFQKYVLSKNMFCPKMCSVQKMCSAHKICSVQKYDLSYSIMNSITIILNSLSECWLVGPLQVSFPTLAQTSS